MPGKEFLSNMNKFTLFIYLLATSKFISHISGGWRWTVRVPAWLGSGQSPLLGCRLLTSPGFLTWQRTREPHYFNCVFIFLLVEFS